MDISHLKKNCIGCGLSKLYILENGGTFNKEHLSPEWLIRRTNTNNTGVTWLSRKMIPALSVTIPICKECNDIFAKRLESPVKHIFDKLESGLGVTDHEAELLVRWMWKFEGMFWQMRNGITGFQSGKSLRSRVLGDLSDIREHIVLAIARIETIEPDHGDLPMGLDSLNSYSGIFVSGVFSKLAILVSLKKYAGHIPENFSIYSFSEEKERGSADTIFKPKIGFNNDNEAVFVTIMASPKLSNEHDKDHLQAVFLDEWSSIMSSLKKKDS